MAEADGLARSRILEHGRNWPIFRKSMTCSSSWTTKTKAASQQMMCGRLSKTICPAVRSNNSSPVLLQTPSGIPGVHGAVDGGQGARGERAAHADVQRGGHGQHVAPHQRAGPGLDQTHQCGTRAPRQPRTVGRHDGIVTATDESLSRNSKMWCREGAGGTVTRRDRRYSSGPVLTISGALTQCSMFATAPFRSIASQATGYKVMSCER